MPNALAEPRAVPRTLPKRKRHVSLPAVALLVGALYFLWVVLLVFRLVAVPGLEPSITVVDWANLGALIMVVLLILLVADHLRSRRPLPEGAAQPEERGEISGAPRITDEIVVTAETWQGRRVLEYSRPAKSERPASVYAKCLVPIDSQLVLRIEDLVAEARE